MAPLYGLTAPTAQRVRQLLADGGGVEGRASQGSTARGVTWLKVNGAMDAEGWHSAVVSLDLAGEWEDLEQTVYVKSFDGAGLTVGNRYICTRTGDDADGYACFRAVSFGQSHNYIINGGFSVDQRSWSGVGTGNYAWDRWYVQHDFGGPANCTYAALSKYGGSGGYGWIQKMTGGNGGILVAQVVENIETGKIRAGNLTMGVTAYSGSGNGTTLNIAAFAWNGSPNSSSSKNLVASWDANHTPTFNTANLTMLASATTPLSNTTFASLSIDFAANATTTTNIVMAVWSENVQGAFKPLYLQDAFLVPTGSKVVWDDYTDAVRRCSRYYFAARYDWLHGHYRDNTGDNASLLGGGNMVVSAAIPVPSMMNTPTLRLSIPGPVTGTGAFTVHNLNKANLIGTASTVAAGNLTINAVRVQAAVQSTSRGDSREHTQYVLTLKAGNGTWVGCGTLGNSANPTNGDNLMLHFVDSNSHSGNHPSIAFDSEI